MTGPSTTKQQRPGHALAPHSTLACQVQATDAWRQDLRALLDHAKERFADVCWTFRQDDEQQRRQRRQHPYGDDEEEDEDDDDREGETSSLSQRRLSSSVSSHVDGQEDTLMVWAHKAILYARASNSFQARYLQLKTPAANLGAAFASTSTVSLPAVRPTSSASNYSSVPAPASRPTSSIRNETGRRKHYRGPAPPSSYSMARGDSQATASSAESEDEEGFTMVRPVGGSVKRTRSNGSVSSSVISRPMSRNGSQWQMQHTPSSASLASTSMSRPAGNMEVMDDSDNYSILSTASTIRAPMNLHDVNPGFFEASLEYIYTAEESIVEVFEFLHEDRMGPQDGVEKRLDKLRQDLVFMWRSRLYADIEIVIGEDHVGVIPDVNASVLSLPLNELAEDDDTASFFAHRMMLVSRSPYFAAQLLSPYADSQTRVVRLPSPPFTPAAMHFTLGFIYTGTLFFSNRTFDLSTAFQLWLAGAYLQIETLQSLVSSLIAQDFCHMFACSPPCKTCLKRVPRTLTFVSRPDVNDARLYAMAMSAIASEHFGVYWSKEVGNLAYSTRGSIVTDVCDKIDRQPGFIVTALRQLAIVGKRIDVERSTQWVESLRWMCETVQSHIGSRISVVFGEVVASSEWSALVQGVGFMNDVLEQVLCVLLDNLDESHAAFNYQVMVGNVLLNDEGPPPAHVAQVVEEARASIVNYIRKRWVNIRSSGAFNRMQLWSLKELADEIDIPYADLLLPESDAAVASLSRPTAKGGNGDPMAPFHPAARRVSSRMPAPGTVVDGEREAGPIHLRAAVLNRNAARASVAQSHDSSQRSPSNVGVEQSSRTLAADSPDEPSFARRSSTASPRGSLNSRATVDGEGAQDLSPSVASVSPGRVSGRGLFPSSLTSPRDRTRSTRQPSVQRDDASEQSLASPSRPAASVSATDVRRNVNRNSTASTVRQPAATASSSSSNRTPADAQQGQNMRKRSTQSIKSAKLTSASDGPSSGNRVASTSRANDYERVRLASTASAASVKTNTTARSVHTRSEQQQGRVTPTPSRAQPSLRPQRSRPEMSSVKRAAQAFERDLLPTPPSTVKAPYARATKVVNAGKAKMEASDAMQIDVQPKSSAAIMGVESTSVATPRGKSTLGSSSLRGTILSMGIPCMIAPTTSKGKSTRFRATVKYIGPLLSDDASDPVIGVEVLLPLPAGLDESSFDFHDGVYAGHQYFSIGMPDHSAQTAELHHKPEREARRKRIEQMLQSHVSANETRNPSFVDVGDDSQATLFAADKTLSASTLPSAKRRKDSAGRGKGMSSIAEPVSTSSRGLFIKPSEVLWVVT